MGTDVTNTISIQNDFINNLTQDLSETCSANCSITVDNNAIIVGSGSTVGDITISAGNGCQADATCSMAQSADSSLNNLISSMIDQEITSVTDLFGDFQNSDLTNNVDAVNDLTNNITQISDQTCQANSSVSVDDNTIYLGSNTTGGDLTITGGQGSSATASCAMTNMAKLSVFNQGLTKGNQDGTSLGMFSVVSVVLIVLIIVGGIIVVILAAAGSLAFIFGGKSKSTDDLDGLDPGTVNEVLGEMVV